jgi:hypothetical protein
MSSERRARSAPLKIPIDRLINTTIALLSVLIIYDGWEALTFWGVVAVIVGPLLAVFLSHVFAGTLAHRVELGRELTRRERRGLLAQESRLLLLAVPPLVILAGLSIVGVSYRRIIQVIVLVGMLSLGAWGAEAGRRAHLTGWALVITTAYGLLLGAVILLLRALLQPGTLRP